MMIIHHSPVDVLTSCMTYSIISIYLLILVQSPWSAWCPAQQVLSHHNIFRFLESELAMFIYPSAWQQFLLVLTQVVWFPSLVQHTVVSSYLSLRVGGSYLFAARLPMGEWLFILISFHGILIFIAANFSQCSGRSWCLWCSTTSVIRKGLFQSLSGSCCDISIYPGNSVTECQIIWSNPMNFRLYSIHMLK